MFSFFGNEVLNKNRIDKYNQNVQKFLKTPQNQLANQQTLKQMNDLLQKLNKMELDPTKYYSDSIPPNLSSLKLNKGRLKQKIQKAEMHEKEKRQALQEKYNEVMNNMKRDKNTSMKEYWKFVYETFPNLNSYDELTQTHINNFKKQIYKIELQRQQQEAQRKLAQQEARRRRLAQQAARRQAQRQRLAKQKAQQEAQRQRLARLQRQRLEKQEAQQEARIKKQAQQKAQRQRLAKQRQTVTPFYLSIGGGILFYILYKVGKIRRC